MKKLFRIIALLVFFSIPAFSQVPVSLAPVARQQFLSSSGVPLSGGLVYTYNAGTSTPAPTYTDSSGTTLNSNPVVLDSGGFASIWLAAQSYKICVNNAAGAQQWCVDNISGATGEVQASPQYRIFIQPNSGTQPIAGPSNLSTDVTLNDLIVPGQGTFKIINAIRNADQFPGATADAKINAAISDLPASGGTVDARGFGATPQTWAATVAVGTPTKMVTLLLDSMTKFNVTISNNTDVLDLGPGSAVRTTSGTLPQSSLGGFTFSPTAAIASGIKLVNQGAANAGFNIDAPYLQGNATMTMTGAGIDLLNALQAGTVYNPMVVGMPGPLLRVSQTAGSAVGPINIYNPVLDGQGVAGANPVLIQAVASGGVMGTLNFFGGSYAHPGSGGLAIIDIQGITGNDTDGVTFYGPQIEATNSSDIGIRINNSSNVTISSPFFTQSATPGATAVQILGSNTDQVVIDNLTNFNLWTNTLVNSVNGLTIPAVTQNRISHYTYNNSGRTLTNLWEDAAGRILTVDGNGVAVGGLTTGDCVQAGTAGLLTSSPCGGPTQTSAATNFGTNLTTQTLVTGVPATGMVIVYASAVVSTAGTGCSSSPNTVQVNVTYTAPGGTVVVKSLGATVTITGDGFLDFGADSASNVLMLAAKAGTPVSYVTVSALGSTGCSVTPQYTVYAKAN